jgi:1-deoxyxylulose-5-phosphate synthase
MATKPARKTKPAARAKRPRQVKPSSPFIGITYDLSDDYRGMPYRLMGQSGLRASSVGLGTWKFGYPEQGDGARVGAKTAFKIFDRAAELGVTFWDTANRYNNGSGNSERVIGEWLKHNPDQRSNIIVATKLHGASDGWTPNHFRLSRWNILNSFYECLRRLQVDYIDLLYFHTVESITPIEESLSAIEDLVRMDLLRYFGVGNLTVEQLAAYQAAEKTMSIRCRVVAVQNHYDLLNGENDTEPGVLDYCARSGPAFVAWSPLARGLLTNRYLDPGKAGPGDRLFDEGALQENATPSAIAKLQRLAYLAKLWDMEVSQLALAYMLTLPGMGPVIPAASTVQQLESNAKAGLIKLTPSQQFAVKAALVRQD